jgi:magnesium transporter
MILDGYDEASRFTMYTSKHGLTQSKTLVEDISADTLWLDVVNPSPSELQKLAAKFSIHPLTIEDVQVMDEREKCEMFSEYLFIAVRTMDQSGPKVTDEWGRQLPLPVNVYLILSRGILITIHKCPLPHIPHVITRLERDRRFNDLSTDWIMYTVLDDFVDEFMPVLKTLEMESDSIDDLVMVLSQSDRHEMLRRVGTARRRVTHLQRLLKPKVDVMKALTKRNSDRLKPHTVTYIRDIYDHVQLMVDNLGHYHETLDRSHSNYIGQINIEMADFSNRMTWVINKLSAAAVLAVPLSLIAGMWGMNVPVPGQPGTSLKDYGPFFTIIGSMVFMMCCMFIVSRRFGWL